MPSRAWCGCLLVVRVFGHDPDEEFTAEQSVSGFRVLGCKLWVVP